MFSMSSGRVSVSPSASSARQARRRDHDVRGGDGHRGGVRALASVTVPSVQRIALLSVSTAVLNEYWLAVVASRLRPEVAEAPKSVVALAEVGVEVLEEDLVAAFEEDDLEGRRARAGAREVWTIELLDDEQAIGRDTVGLEEDVAGLVRPGRPRTAEWREPEWRPAARRW